MILAFLRAAPRRVRLFLFVQDTGSAGSFSEDRPLGWDPVAAGNRAGDGMACNNNDRRQWRKQGIVVGAAASKTQA